MTGAGGFIGQATAKNLIEHGHQVIGLAHSDASAEKITKLGAEVLRGDLEDTESLKKGAKSADGVIHLGFVLDFSDMARSCRIDREAIEAMGSVMAGTGKPLVIASGTLLVAKDGRVSTEDSEAVRSDQDPFSERAKSEDSVVKLSKEQNIRGSVIRLSPTVHGVGDKAFMTILADTYRKSGTVVYVGDGSARWAAVHRLDAAALFRLALEKGTPGAMYNAAAEQGIPMKDIMTTLGKHLKLPVEGRPLEKAVEAIGFLAYVTSKDNPVSSEKTQKELGWHPTQPGLLADLDANYSF